LEPKRATQLETLCGFVSYAKGTVIRSWVVRVSPQMLRQLTPRKPSPNHSVMTHLRQEAPDRGGTI